MEKKIKKNIVIALFIAIGVVINSLRVNGISFGGLPIIFSGFMLGPVSGFIVGALTDVVAFIVRPSATGGFNPIFMLTSALTGFIPVFVAKLLNRNKDNYKLWQIFIGVLVGQMFTSVLLVPYFIHILYHKNYFVTVSKAFAKQLFSIPIYSIIIIELYYIFKLRLKIDFK